MLKKSALSLVLATLITLVSVSVAFAGPDNGIWPTGINEPTEVIIVQMTE